MVFAGAGRSTERQFGRSDSSRKPDCEVDPLDSFSFLNCFLGDHLYKISSDEEGAATIGSVSSNI
jgi:hypothetical protein